MDEERRGTSTPTLATLPAPAAYFAVARIADDRFCVQLVRDGLPPRTSYTSQIAAVIKQAQHVGSLPVYTTDAEVLQLCHTHHINVITASQQGENQ
ncbi:MAG: hypothetical protein MUD01_14740 [Chloroflexaceae bacterium]|jgi:hypothetical protein|nr:hypothetical protein [Chloroflexaceae bacterium]